MLSPHKRMSAFQSAQMYSLQDANIHNLAVRGVFDDCQDVVKKVNADAAFKAQHRIGAVNSINWARVAAQVVYYFKGYFAATRDDREQVSFAVPSGNFGNIYAGYVARRMGLPIRRLILASNENDVLDEFFRTGNYRSSKAVKQTTSPVDGHLQGLELRALRVRPRRPRRRARQGPVAAAATPRASSTSRTRRTGRAWRNRASSPARAPTTTALPPSVACSRNTGVIIDPHTADGLKVGLEYREAGVPLICLETALPVKFGDTHPRGARPRARAPGGVPGPRGACRSASR